MHAYRRRAKRLHRSQHSVALFLLLVVRGTEDRVHRHLLHALGLPDAGGGC